MPDFKGTIKQVTASRYKVPTFEDQKGTLFITVDFKVFGSEAEARDWISEDYKTVDLFEEIASDSRSRLRKAPKRKHNNQKIQIAPSKEKSRRDEREAEAGPVMDVDKKDEAAAAMLVDVAMLTEADAGVRQNVVLRKKNESQWVVYMVDPVRQLSADETVSREEEEFFEGEEKEGDDDIV